MIDFVVLDDVVVAVNEERRRRRFVNAAMRHPIADAIKIDRALVGAIPAIEVMDVAVLDEVASGLEFDAVAAAEQNRTGADVVNLAIHDAVPLPRLAIDR